MAYQHPNSSYSTYEGQELLNQKHRFTGSVGHNIVVGIDEIDPSLVGLTNASQVNYSAYQQAYQDSEQQQPLQRFIGEPTQMGPLRGSQMYARSMSNTFASIPRSSTRMDSPTPSLYSHDITATSSANSPVDDKDLLYDAAVYSSNNNYDFCPQQSHSGSHFLPDLALLGESIPQYSLPSNTLSHNCVNMSQVQNYADYGFDEGYNMQNGGGNDYIEVDHPGMRADMGTGYKLNGDEGLGTSILDEISQHTVATPARTHEFDANAELDDISAAASPASDTDYLPHHKTTQRRGKRSRDCYDSSTTSRAPKRARTTKSTTNTCISSHFNMNNTHCDSCNSMFTTSALLSKHVSKEHTKPFICVFSFAGCASVFATKNEWKRHVYSQHCNFNTWTCNMGGCAKAGKGKNASGSAAGANANLHGAHFNRKDLYTQHLKRMHTPRQAEKAGKGSLAWEEEIKHLQESNCHLTRQMPGELGCPMRSCGVRFQGKGCWDDKMEHVGKHLETSAQARARGGETEEFEQGDDELMVQWAVREGIVVADGNGKGRYVFVGDATRRRVEIGAGRGGVGGGQDSEDDAEGDDEYV